MKRCSVSMGGKPFYTLTLPHAAPHQPFWYHSIAAQHGIYPTSDKNIKFRHSDSRLVVELTGGENKVSKYNMGKTTRHSRQGCYSISGQDIFEEHSPTGWRRASQNIKYSLIVSFLAFENMLIDESMVFCMLESLDGNVINHVFINQNERLNLTGE